MAGVGELLGEAGVSIPEVSWAGLGNVLLYILIGILLAGAIIVGAYFYIKGLKFNKNIFTFQGNSS